jgi:hypothetical protein
VNGSGLHETKTSYQPGVLDTVEVPLNSAFGTNLAWVKWGTGANDPVEGLNDLSVNKNLSTTGRGKYGLTTPQTLTEGTVWFHLEYVPFAIFENTKWQEASFWKGTTSALKERPVWVIRNGLTDAAATWTPGMAYTGTDGGIAIGVVDPDAPRPTGLYEDNNPWPVPGTSGKTSVEIQTWVNAYCADQGISTPTLAGIRTAKGGSYTLLPRRYYARTDGDPAKSGASWQDANSGIPELVARAKANYLLAELPVEIWVAAGTYGGGGTVIDISGGTDYLSIYGGFMGTESAAIGSLPTGRSDWFNTHASYNNKLTPNNRYGTVKDAARKTTLDAGGSGSVVKVDGATNLVLDGFTITNGGNTGLWIRGGTAATVFKNLEISNNRPPSGIDGGGIYSEGTSSAPTLDNLTITGNETSGSGFGAGIFIYGVNHEPTAAECIAPRITNALISENKAPGGAGGGIVLYAGGPIIRVDAPHPYFENIIVTGNQSKTMGGGIYNDMSAVIVNAIVSGNTQAHTSDDAANFGGGIYLCSMNSTVLVNVLVSGNSSTTTASMPSLVAGSRHSINYAGGGGIKVINHRLTMINCTVSGNYSSFANGMTRGAGVMVFTPEAGSKDPNVPRARVQAYNSIIAGNSGLTDLSTSMKAIDTAVDDREHYDTQFIAYNSLVGGYSKTLLDTGGEEPYPDGFPVAGLATSYDLSFTSSYLAYLGLIVAGSGNLDGTAYRPTILPLYSTSPSPSSGELSAVQQLFTAFPTYPDASSTGVGYNSAAWNFRLNGSPAGVVNGGSAAFLSAPYTSVTYTQQGGAGQPYLVGSPRIGAITTDVEGVARVQGNEPDLGAYETGSLLPSLRYTVFNAKPQSAMTANHGYLTVNGVNQLGGIMPGTEVTVVAYPDTTPTNYAVQSMSYQTSSGVTVPITGGTFIMPAEHVTVDAVIVYSPGGSTGWGS